MARRIGVRKNQQVLDVACGTGEWLLACKELGAFTNGVDLSERAISACKTSLGEGEYFSMPAEVLPFEDARFDVVTCLGSLEHFIDPVKALKEMVRVAKTDAIFLLLVPNADFLTRRLGLFGGTYQTDAKEEVRPLSEWKSLFEEAGLDVTERWRDLHVLSWSWISSGGKRVFGLVIDFGTSQSPKSTQPLTTYWCPSRPGHQALRNNFASSLLLRT
ncbi:class I SAM-dependent methyltransferase, partial [Thiolapillus sp.]|uniref:class I SAM-dependent methyltransferase n=1 Tax=Thiolapillus sp. TaxID=2017437 RepID=UPI003AF9C246